MGHILSPHLKKKDCLYHQNQKYADSVFKMNSLLTNATDTNSISDIVALANGYKGMSVQIESDRERLSAIQRLFTANRDIDYVDESIQ